MENQDNSNCNLCNQELKPGLSAIGKKIFQCRNTKCPSGQLISIETRLNTIEKKLNIEYIPICDISVNKKEIIRPIKENYYSDIEMLPLMSLKAAKHKFYELETKLGRRRLLSQIQNVANGMKRAISTTSSSNYSLEKLKNYTILLAYLGKPFVAAKQLLDIGGEETILFMAEIIERANSVLVRSIQRPVDPKTFYSSLFRMANRNELSTKIKDDLRILAGYKPEIKKITPEKIPVSPKQKTKSQTLPIHSINITTHSSYSPKKIKDVSFNSNDHLQFNWLEKFKPKEGWEFTIGANWLRWVGVGIILLSLFALIVWSSQFVQLSERRKIIEITTFLSVIIIAFILHLSSFFLIRRSKQSKIQYNTPLAYSLAFLAFGIYYLIAFTLRFHSSSPISGNESIYLILCLLLIFTLVITAWNHNSSVLFLEGFTFVMWLIWHISSQINTDKLQNFPIDILWFSYFMLILVFLGLAYIRKDMMMTTSIQILAVSVLFFPNSSEVFATHLVVGTFNATTLLLLCISISYFLIGFKFPLGVPNQFNDLISRDHISITSLTPVFASFFLLSYNLISEQTFTPFFFLFTTVYLCLAYYQKDLGMTFLIVLLTQLFWLLSVGTMENTFILIPEINKTLVVLLFLTLINWFIALKFPLEAQPRFWKSIYRKHLTYIAVGPIFISFFIMLTNSISSSIFIIYLVLFCMLWSSIKGSTVETSNFPFDSITTFDFVVYSSIILYLIAIIIHPNDTFGLLLGFFVFPLLMLSTQNIPTKFNQKNEIKEYYVILNNLFTSLTFLIMVISGFFTQFSESVSSIIPIIDLQNEYNWAFLGYLWIIAVSIISITNYRNYISRNISKLVICIIPLFTMALYLLFVPVSDVIAVSFILTSYIQLITLWLFLEKKNDSKTQITTGEHLYVLPSLMLLQVITYLMQKREIINWSLSIGLFINLILPFSLGIIMIVRKKINPVVDSYLIISTPVVTYLLFLLYSSRLQDESWTIQVVFLGVCLFYIYLRILFENRYLKPNNNPQIRLQSFFQSKSTLTIEGLLGNKILFLYLSVIANITIYFSMMLVNTIAISVFLIYLVLCCILWRSIKDFLVDIPDLDLYNVSIFDLMVYTSGFLYFTTILLEPDDSLGFLLGFLVFPLLLVLAQILSEIYSKNKNIEEKYVIINSIYTSLIFIIIAGSGYFSQVSKLISSFVSNPLIIDVNNWVFFGFLWIILISILAVIMFHTNINDYLSKITLCMTPLITLTIYLITVPVSEIIAISFIIASYIYLLILWLLLEKKSDSTTQTTSEEHLYLLPTLALLQVLTHFLQFISIINWTIFIGIGLNLILPLLFGAGMIIRKRVNHVMDSYLILYISIVTCVQFLLIDSQQQSEAWLIQLVYLGVCLAYIYGRIIGEKNTLRMANDSKALLNFIFPRERSFSHAENFGLNLLIMSVLGFISTTICFKFFNSISLPTLTLTFFDSIILLSIVISLILLSLNRRVALMNALTIYTIVIAIRLQFLNEINVSDWNVFIFTGLAIQIIIHLLLIRIDKSERLLGVSTEKWQLKFQGRETWTTDSLQLIALLNPLFLYYFILEVFGTIILSKDNMILSVIIVSILLGIYYVVLTRKNVSNTIIESGLFFSVIIAWGMTSICRELIEMIYFTTACTAFLCILLGLWIFKKEWRFLGLGIIGGTMVFSTLYLVQLSEALLTIIGFGMLGIISIIIGFLYSKFASQFKNREDEEERKEGVIQGL